jgi:hypothetical protein
MRYVRLCCPVMVLRVAVWYFLLVFLFSLALCDLVL